MQFVEMGKRMGLKLVMTRMPFLWMVVQTNVKLKFLTLVLE